MPWHAIRTRPRHERSVAALIDKTLALPAYNPEYYLTYLTPRTCKPKELLLPYLPTYIFAEWATHDPHLWHALHAIQGVLSFVGAPYPDPIPNLEIDRLRAYIASPDNHFITAAPPINPLVVGNYVTLTKGPYAGSSGHITWLHINNLVARVEIPLFRRLTSVTCSASWCELAAAPLKEQKHTGFGSSKRSRVPRRRAALRLFELYPATP